MIGMFRLLRRALRPPIRVVDDAKAARHQRKHAQREPELLWQVLDEIQDLPGHLDP